MERRNFAALCAAVLCFWLFARAFGTDALLMDSGRKIALGRANDVLTPANLDRVYGMDVAAWMRGLYRQWAE